MRQTIPVKSLPLNDIIEWDILNWAELIEKWQPIIDKLPRNSRVLAIGERNGGMSAWLALNGFNVWCTDREHPTDKAKEIHAKYGLTDRITYGTFDVVYIDERFYNSFDLVVAKSVIGGVKTIYNDPGSRSLDVQQLAVRNIYACLTPGGYFLSAENMTGSFLLKKTRELQGKNQGWRHLNSAEIELLFKDFTCAEIHAFGILPGGTGFYLVNKIIYLINKYLLFFLPPTYKYIAMVAARKDKN